MAEKEPKSVSFDKIEIRPIENAIIIQLSVGSDHKEYTFKSYRQVLQFLKTIA